MLNAIVHFSVRYRGVVLTLAAGLLVYGGLVLQRTKYDVFPEFAPPQVSVQTESPGLTPEQVEILVTRPLENAINGVQGIAAVRSQSIQGLSVVTTTFSDGADIYRARQSIQLPIPNGLLKAGFAAYFIIVVLLYFITINTYSADGRRLNFYANVALVSAAVFALIFFPNGRRSPFLWLGIPVNLFALLMSTLITNHARKHIGSISAGIRRVRVARSEIAAHFELMLAACDAERIGKGPVLTLIPDRRLLSDGSSEQRRRHQERNGLIWIKRAIDIFIGWELLIHAVEGRNLNIISAVPILNGIQNPDNKLIHHARSQR